MFKDIKNYKLEAWNSIRNNYWLSFFICFLYISAGWLLHLSLTDYVRNILIAFIAGSAIGGVIDVALSSAFIYIVRHKHDVNADDLYAHVTHGGWKQVSRDAILGIIGYCTILLGIFLFLIPSIIAFCIYVIATFVAAEDADKSAVDCLKDAYDMLRCHFLDDAMLCLSFIGWFLLCAATGGLGFFFLWPYVVSAYAMFYLDISGQLHVV